MINYLPFQPGTGLPAYPAGGYGSISSPIQEHVIGQPDSENSKLNIETLRYIEIIHTEINTNESEKKEIYLTILIDYNCVNF